MLTLSVIRWVLISGIFAWLGFVIYSLIESGPPTEDGAELLAQSRGEEPAPVLWQPLKHEVVGPQATLVIHALSLRADEIKVLYSIAADSDADASLLNPILNDETGSRFELVSSKSIGTALGVTAGVAAFRNAQPVGTLTFGSAEITLGGTGATKPAGGWRITFAESRTPVDPSSYSLNMLIAPEVIAVRDKVVGKAGGAQVTAIKLLVKDGSQEAAVYGTTANGETRSLSEEDFAAELAKTGSSEMAPPPQWPSPVTASSE